MSMFFTDLSCTLLPTTYEGRECWQLNKPLVYNSFVLGKQVIVPSGFVTDFASVPRLPVAYMLAGGVASKAAVVHDYLYAKADVSRELADAVLEEAAKVQRVPDWKVAIMYRMVRLFGGAFYGNPKISKV